MKSRGPLSLPRLLGVEWLRKALVKVAIGATLILLTILQIFSIPGQFRYMAEENPQRAYLRWPLSIAGMVAILALQILLISLWILIDEIRGQDPFSRRSQKLLSRMKYSLATFLFILCSGLVFVLSQADDPGFPFLLTIITGCVTLILLVVDEIAALFKGVSRQ